jgi:hypothetical protein
MSMTLVMALKGSGDLLYDDGSPALQGTRAYFVGIWRRKGPSGDGAPTLSTTDLYGHLEFRTPREAAALVGIQGLMLRLEDQRIIAIDVNSPSGHFTVCYPTPNWLEQY